MQSNKILTRLNDLHPKIIDLSLDRIKTLLKKLNHPENKLQKVIHVAGTNGKGSTIAFINEICERAGLTVNRYTSPHLVNFSERIYVCGQNINELSLTKILSECEEVNAGDPITLFEITTAAAFLAFSRTPADVTLIETGLGGRFDATNVIQKPTLTIITPISKDHVNWLGHTLDKIAFEKAGILKPNVPALIGPQPTDAGLVIEKHAKKLGVKTITYSQDWELSSSPSNIYLRFKKLHSVLPIPSLQGEHQLTNAATAAIATKLLKKPEINDNVIGAGIRSTFWAGRLQKLTTASTKSFPKGWSLWIDGGHNPGAAEALATTVSQWQQKPLHIVFGYINSRDPKEFLRPLANYIKTLNAITIPGEASSMSAKECKLAAQQLGITASVSSDFMEAMDKIIKVSSKPGRILICGSLYLVGAVLRHEQTMVN
ncbi:MAG: bifunctional folylpolyglutamate synthase/dihydrofolate synthase [Rhodospirillaceae bacterium]|nr:bifunctional folylpolyglutamate synthase/dihydrofolate synthase [Rhodospirillaceae bacterium]